FDALRVHGRNYPFVHRHLDDPQRQQKPEGEAWRIAFIRTHTWKHAPEYARQKMEAWVSELSKWNIQVEEVELPASFDASHSMHASIYNFSLAYYFQEESENSEFVSPIMRELIEAGRNVDGSTYHHALRAQESLCREMNDLLAGYDALVSLSTAGSAPARGTEEKPDPSLIWTLTHLPSVSAPAFTCPEGNPFGVQIAARRFRDYRMLEFIQMLVDCGHLPAGPNPLLSI
ncbi:MAG: amidase family protein, partial [Chthoniobacterales bacterium]